MGALGPEWKKLARALAKRDPRLKPVIQGIGMPSFTTDSNAFRALADSILSQQLAIKAAAAIRKRFVALAPPYPKAEVLLTLTDADLRVAGVSAQKASYLRALSERWMDTTWRKGWGKLSEEELVARLTEVKGIGEWTAHMFLIFSQGRPNVFPVGDYGIRRGLQLLLALREMPKPKEMRDLVPEWEGAYSIASWYLWKGQDQKLIK